MHFDEVKAEDFTTFSRVPPPHLQMEQFLMQLGEGELKEPVSRRK